MKKSSFHVNPVVNKWEEEQRRARMEKMIQRAKSTLPPEARGGAKQPGTKKPSPYAAENAAARLGRKQSSSGHEAAAGGPVPMDVQELDSLIYNRVQEILGMPLMRRAAAARGAAGKGGTPPKAPMSARGGRKPAWNSEWSTQAASAPANFDERHVGSAGNRNGPATKASERAAPKPNSTAEGNTRRNPYGGTPTKPTRHAAPKPIDIPPAGSGTAAAQHRPSSGTQGADGRVVLLPSPSTGSTGNKNQAARPTSSRYGNGMDPAGGGGGNAGSHSHLLEQSVVSAIVALNAQSTEAQAAAARIAKHPQGQRGQRPGAAYAAAGSSGAGRGVTRSSSLVGSAAGAAAPRQLSSSASACTTGGGRGASSLKSKVGASQGGSPGGGAVTVSSQRPPLAKAGRTSGTGAPPAATHARPASKEGHDDEDAYADDDFEEYEGSDDERAAGQGEAAEDDGGGGASHSADGASPDVDILRHSVSALNGLVQLKIQQELARSQQLQQTLRRQSQQDVAGSTAGTPTNMLASMALVGAEDAEAPGHGLGHGDLGNSDVMDGLRQSDLDYLARLGGGDPNEGHEGTSSADERACAIEPGAPAGTNKTWGDRQPWAAENDAAATGLQQLRARQEKEKLKQQQQGGSDERRGSRQGSEQGDLAQAQRQSRQGPGGRSSSGGKADEEDDSVLLGETMTPRHRTGATAQMQAVSSALAALATSGQLTTDDAQELQTQTDALYGSLVQLHSLMTGPRGAELKTSSPDGAAGSGFSPLILSPIDSPTQSSGRASAVLGGEGSFGTGGRGERSASGRSTHMDPSEHRLASGHGETCKPAEDVRQDNGANSHIQLTPKHRLVAEDVAWMAGLVQSLSESLHIENGELPGM